MDKKARILIIWLVVVFAAITAFSLFFTRYEADHICLNDDCSICAILSGCSELLKQLCSGRRGAAAPAALHCFVAVISAAASLLITAKTPVSLKVKLSD